MNMQAQLRNEIVMLQQASVENQITTVNDPNSTIDQDLRDIMADLDAKDMQIIALIAQDDFCTTSNLSELIEASNLTKHSVVKTMSKLDNLGLITINAYDDNLQGNNYVQLTFNCAIINELYAKSQRDVTRKFEKMLNNFTAEQQMTIFAFLKSYNGIIGVPTTKPTDECDKHATEQHYEARDQVDIDG